MSFEKYVLPYEGPETGTPKLNLHTFRAVIQEYLDGEQTVTACREAIEAQLGVTLTSAEVDDITNLLNYVQNGSDLANKLKRADEVYRIFVLAEAKCIWFLTRESIRARLGFS